MKCAGSRWGHVNTLFSGLVSSIALHARACVAAVLLRQARNGRYTLTLLFEKSSALHLARHHVDGFYKSWRYQSRRTSQPKPVKSKKKKCAPKPSHQYICRASRWLRVRKPNLVLRVLDAPQLPLNRPQWMRAVLRIELSWGVSSFLLSSPVLARIGWSAC
jgi:hypothetical protein